MRRIIKIDDLNLALDNPRLTDSRTEEEEIEKLIYEQKRKLLVLAEDIIDNGLNPLDIIAVYPSEKDEGKYVVAEGNRRVATIKILNNPDLIVKYDDKIYKSFSKLALKYTKKIREMEAWIFKNSIDPSLLHWQEIKHMGEQKGKGTSKWDSTQKDRYKKKISGESLLLDFWAELEQYKILSYDEIMSITKTNWERILREVGLKFLGIKKRGNLLIIPIDDLITFTEKMKCIQNKLANETVAKVYGQKEIDIFFDEVSEELYGKPVEKEEQLDIDNLIAKVENVNEASKTNGYFSKESENTRSDTNTKKDLFNGCKTVIPNKYAIRSSNTRINKVINELKVLSVDDYPNSCGCLLRLLFELSAKHYLEKLNDVDSTSEDFQQVLNKAANELINREKINKTEHSALKKDIDNLRLLFNGYMHNTDSYPSTEAIKSIFKAHKKYLSECL